MAGSVVEVVEMVEEVEEQLVFMDQLDFHEVAHFLSAKHFNGELEEFLLLARLQGILSKEWSNLSEIFKYPTIWFFVLRLNLLTE